MRLLMQLLQFIKNSGNVNSEDIVTVSSFVIAPASLDLTKNLATGVTHFSYTPRTKVIEN